MPDRGFHGVEQTLRVFSGARCVRVVHPPGQAIAEHRHDWPFLMLVGLGDFIEQTEGGEARVAGPSAVLHPPGTCHANCIGAFGMETVSIEFDPAWLRLAGFDLTLGASRTWAGGPAVRASRALSVMWREGRASERAASRSTADFLRLALSCDADPQPSWLTQVRNLLGAARPLTTAEIARRLGLCPAWLARAYLAATGEGIGHTVRRLRVERAMSLLRTTPAAAADIALAVGFCDQSHMNRAFRAVAGRTPMQVRAEGRLLAQVA